MNFEDVVSTFSKEEQKLFQMLSWLAEGASYWNDPVKTRGDGVFYFHQELPIKVTDEKFVGRDYCSIEFDFKNRKASWYSANESGHNGDHFGSERGEIAWQDALTSGEVVSAWAKKKLVRVRSQELEEQAKKTADAFIEKQFAKKFGDR